MSRKALADYLSFGYIPAPDTAFRGICMLEPASLLTLDGEGAARIRRYWELPPIAPADPSARADSYVEALREKLDEAVKLRLMSDVPLGAFLSGGPGQQLDRRVNAPTQQCADQDIQHRL